MAENTTLPGTGEIIAADELTTINGAAAALGLKVQRMKVGFGSDNDLRDVDAANPLPVSGPITDAQLRATAVPVSGTFFQTTQPVSAATLPLPAGAATETTVAGVRTDLGTDGTTPPAVLGLGTGVRGWLRSIYEKLTGTLAVTGTFWQATQPVSGTVTANAGTGTLAVSLATAPTTPVTGTFWQATQPVSGTFFQAAQPITDNAGSLTVDAPVGTPAFVRLSDGTAAIATLPVSLASLPTLAAGVNNIGTVQAPAITKGTQGTTGFATQDLKDSGRVMVTFTATAIATVTAEALITLVPYRDLVAGTGATTQAVTSGKRLSLQSMMVTARSTSTVNNGGIVRFRMLAGAVLVGSPVHNSIGVMSSNLATAVIGNAQSANIQFPDGFELSGTMQLGLTQLFSATTATIDVHITGYEY